MMNDNIRQTLDTWLENGGALWIESNTIYPHDVQLMTTNDDGIIADMYECRDEDLKDMDIDSYIAYLAYNALTYFGIDTKPYSYGKWFIKDECIDDFFGGQDIDESYIENGLPEDEVLHLSREWKNGFWNSVYFKADF